MCEVQGPERRWRPSLPRVPDPEEEKEEAVARGGGARIHAPAAPGPHPPPICLTIRPAASPESLERWELLLFPKKSALLSGDFSNQDGDSNSPVTQLGQASGVPTRSHQPDHPHPFQGNPRPNLLGPHLHAWQGNTWRGRSRLAADGRRSPRPTFRPPADLKQEAREQKPRKKTERILVRIIGLWGQDIHL